MTQWQVINIYNILLDYLDEDTAEDATRAIVSYLDNPQSMKVREQKK